MYALPTPEYPERVRVGYSVSRKTGGAVRRNRIKRLLREAVRQLDAALPQGNDIVLIARRGFFKDDGLAETVVSLKSVLERAEREWEKE